MPFRTEKEYKEAIDNLKNMMDDNLIAPHNVPDVMDSIIREMWNSEWWQQKRTNEIRKAGEL